MRLAIPRNVITSAAAQAAVEAAVSYGHAMNRAVVAAVVDNGGELMALLRADGAFAASVSIARDKAYTAATFGVSTAQLAKLVGVNDVLRDGIAMRPGVILFGGGFPLIAEGAVIGGVGVSGGSEEDDCACAQAALAALGLA